MAADIMEHNVHELGLKVFEAANTGALIIPSPPK